MATDIRPGTARAGVWLWPAIALVFAAAPALFWRGLLADEEAIGFLQKNWGDRTVLQKIFDPRGWDFYQARELSYAIDYLDGQWVRLLFRNDLIGFVPASAALACLSVVLIGLLLAPRALPSLESRARWLVLLVFVSNFVFISTMGVLYRATKPLVAPLLLALLLLTLAEYRQARLGPRASFAAAFVLALAMSLLDRQGLFYALAVVLALGLAWMRTHRGAHLVLGIAAAAVAWGVYNYLLGPWIIHSVNGYWPEMRFQRAHPASLMHLQPWRSALDLLGDWTSVLLGGLPPLLLAAAAAVGAAAWAWRGRRRPWHLLATGAGALVALALQITMIAMMVERHPPVTWIDHRLWYYPLPYQVLVLFGLFFGLDLLAARRGGSLPRVALVALAALSLANVLQWPEKRALMEAAPAFGEHIRRSALLVRSLRGNQADPSLDGVYRPFYFECLDRFPRLAARALAQVGEGGGVDMPVRREGRVTAWAERESRIVPRTRAPGRCVLAGAVRLRPGDSVLVLLGSPMPRLLTEVRREGSTEGPEFFRLELDLGVGATDILLVSRLPERQIREEWKRVQAGFALVLPVALWCQNTSTTSTSAGFPVDARVRPD